MKSPSRNGNLRIRNSEPGNPGTFALEIRIRGQTDYLHQESCLGLEDALRVGEKCLGPFRREIPGSYKSPRKRESTSFLIPKPKACARGENVRTLRSFLEALSSTLAVTD